MIKEIIEKSKKYIKENSISLGICLIFTFNKGIINFFIHLIVFKLLILYI